jgi:hypothetical protein
MFGYRLKLDRALLLLRIVDFHTNVSFQLLHFGFSTKVQTRRQRMAENRLLPPFPWAALD